MKSFGSFYIDGKSIQRMKDIQQKAANSSRSTTSYCIQMADTIRDKEKAFDRFEAASHVFGVDSPEADIFLKCAVNLSHQEAINIYSNQKIIKAYEKAMKEETERKEKFKSISMTYDILM